MRKFRWFEATKKEISPGFSSESTHFLAHATKHTETGESSERGRKRMEWLISCTIGGVRPATSHACKHKTRYLTQSVVKNPTTPSFMKAYESSYGACTCKYFFTQLNCLTSQRGFLFKTRWILAWVGRGLNICICDYFHNGWFANEPGWRPNKICALRCEHMGYQIAMGGKYSALKHD